MSAFAMADHGDISGCPGISDVGSDRMQCLVQHSNQFDRVLVRLSMDVKADPTNTEAVEAYTAYKTALYAAVEQHRIDNDMSYNVDKPVDSQWLSIALLIGDDISN